MTLSTLRFNVGASVVPGDKICADSGWQAGPGTYRKNGVVYASRLGRLATDKNSGGVAIVSVVHTAPYEPPGPGDVVLARLERKTDRWAFCELLTTPKGKLLPSTIEATLTPDDAGLPVPGSERVLPWKQAYRPGDLILVRLLTHPAEMGAVVLTTDDVALGVVHAQQDGTDLFPVAWNLVQSKDGSVQEKRKCAAPPTTTAQR